MRIRELKTFVVGNPPPTYGGRYFLFLKLITDDGVEGLGEVYAASLAPDVIVKALEDVFERHVLDADPFAIETLWRNVYARGYSGRPDISLMGVLSGIEMAMWDIVGKACNKPVYALLGGKVHERLRSYTYLYPDAGVDAYAASPVYDNPDAAAARALEYVAMGFTTPPDRTPPSTRASRASSASASASNSAGACAKPSATGPICCLARMASSPFRAPSGLRANSSRTSRCGSRSRRRRKCPSRWRKSRASPRFRSRPANV